MRFVSNQASISMVANVDAIHAEITKLIVAKDVWQAEPSDNHRSDHNSTYVLNRETRTPNPPNHYWPKDL